MDPGDDMAPGDEAPSGEPAAGENICTACGGSGEQDGGRCPTCNGSGVVVEGVGGG